MWKQRGAGVSPLLSCRWLFIRVQMKHVWSEQAGSTHKEFCYDVSEPEFTHLIIRLYSEQWIQKLQKHTWMLMIYRAEPTFLLSDLQAQKTILSSMNQLRAQMTVWLMYSLQLKSKFQMQCEELSGSSLAVEDLFLALSVHWVQHKELLTDCYDLSNIVIIPLVYICFEKLIHQSLVQLYSWNLQIPSI